MRLRTTLDTESFRGKDLSHFVLHRKKKPNQKMGKREIEK